MPTAGDHSHRRQPSRGGQPPDVSAATIGLPAGRIAAPGQLKRRPLHASPAKAAAPNRSGTAAAERSEPQDGSDGVQSAVEFLQDLMRRGRLPLKEGSPLQGVSTHKDHSLSQPQHNSGETGRNSVVATRGWIGRSDATYNWADTWAASQHLRDEPVQDQRANIQRLSAIQKLKTARERRFRRASSDGHSNSSSRSLSVDSLQNSSTFYQTHEPLDPQTQSAAILSAVQQRFKHVEALIRQAKNRPTQDTPVGMRNLRDQAEGDDALSPASRAAAAQLISRLQVLEEMAKSQLEDAVPSGTAKSLSMEKNSQAHSTPHKLSGSPTHRSQPIFRGGSVKSVGGRDSFQFSPPLRSGIDVSEPNETNRSAQHDAYLERGQESPSQVDAFSEYAPRPTLRHKSMQTSMSQNQAIFHTAEELREVHIGGPTPVYQPYSQMSQDASERRNQRCVPSDVRQTASHRDDSCGGLAAGAIRDARISDAAPLQQGISSHRRSETLQSCVDINDAAEDSMGDRNLQDDLGSFPPGQAQQSRTPDRSLWAMLKDMEATVNMCVDRLSMSHTDERLIENDETAEVAGISSNGSAPPRNLDENWQEILRQSAQLGFYSPSTYNKNEGCFSPVADSGHSNLLGSQHDHMRRKDDGSSVSSISLDQSLPSMAAEEFKALAHEAGRLSLNLQSIHTYLTHMGTDKSDAAAWTERPPDTSGRLRATPENRRTAHGPQGGSLHDAWNRIQAPLSFGHLGSDAAYTSEGPRDVRLQARGISDTPSRGYGGQRTALVQAERAVGQSASECDQQYARILEADAKAAALQARIAGCFCELAAMRESVPDGWQELKDQASRLARDAERSRAAAERHAVAGIGSSAMSTGLEQRRSGGIRGWAAYLRDCLEAERGIEGLVSVCSEAERRSGALLERCRRAASDVDVAMESLRYLRRLAEGLMLEMVPGRPRGAESPASRQGATLRRLGSSLTAAEADLAGAESDIVLCEGGVAALARERTEAAELTEALAARLAGLRRQGALLGGGGGAPHRGTSASRGVAARSPSAGGASARVDLSSAMAAAASVTPPRRTPSTDTTPRNGARADAVSPEGMGGREAEPPPMSTGLAAALRRLDGRRMGSARLAATVERLHAAPPAATGRWQAYYRASGGRAPELLRRAMGLTPSVSMRQSISSDDEYSSSD